jgi:hypothetical protein
MNEMEYEILEQEGGSADDAEFAALIGCTVPELLARSQRCKFFSVMFRGHRYWPRWQLGLAGLVDVLPVLAEKGASGFSIVLFFTTPTDVPSLDDTEDELPDVREDDSPLSLLRRCGAAAVQRVVRHARRFGEQGAT